MKGLTDIPGVLVGHASDYDGLTGCTVIRFGEKGAVAGSEIRGFPTGTGEWDLLSPYHVTEKIHAVVFDRRKRVPDWKPPQAFDGFWRIKRHWRNERSGASGGSISDSHYDRYVR